MTLPKRIFDLFVASTALFLVWPLLLVISVVILLRDGAPILYPSARMKSPEREFTLFKFRTMRSSAENSGVTGADKGQRITANGRFLRRTRLDELPQLFNVVRGDISLVGPRPPLREYVEAEASLYAEVLKSRPGITGLATLVYHKHEEWLLAQCKTAAETHAVYLSRCVPTKAHLDLLYQKNSSVCFDIVLLWRTVSSVLGK